MRSCLNGRLAGDGTILDGAKEAKASAHNPGLPFNLNTLS